uniref:Potassium channel domain-containing protein n=1 Tax=Timema bartmani TaxID=61472 RepID=A0A7R9I381_9NEOP|nr:unnamed protein product [Timema bartmani]
MSKKQWCSLLVLFVVYLMMGAVMFNNIEGERERARRIVEAKERRTIHELLDAHYVDFLEDDHYNILTTLEEYCGKKLVNISTDGDEDPILWDFYNSVFFVITVVSTIGYGNLVPTSALGRILMILYAIIGIPMNGILLTALGEFFSKAFLRVHRRYKTQRHETRAGLVTDIVLYLIPGFVVFIFLPAGAFVYFEDWTYDEAVYYAFVTLTTIGFGDFVAGQSYKGHDDLFLVYKIFLIVWILFGLGYLVMILGFITRAMRSKRITRLEHKLAANIKMTQSKIAHGFAKDVTYLRRVLNELYLLKLKYRLMSKSVSATILVSSDVIECVSATILVLSDVVECVSATILVSSNVIECVSTTILVLSDVIECVSATILVSSDVVECYCLTSQSVCLCSQPIYKDEDEDSYRPRTRSSSLPNLFQFIGEADTPASGIWRRRANSEVIPSSTMIPKVFSESDLCRIDKEATFKTSALIQPVELLARFVNALGEVAHGADQDYESDSDDDDETEDGFPSARNGGIQGFADNEIMASEKWRSSGWTIGGADSLPVKGPQYARGRASSAVTIPMEDASTDTHLDDKSLPSNAEWTWSGVDASRKIHKLIRARRKSEHLIRDKSPGPKEKLKGQRLALLNLTSWWKNPLTAKKTKDKAKSLGNLFLAHRKRRQSMPDVQSVPPLTAQQRHYLTHTAAGRNTIGQPQDYGRRASNYSAISSNQDGRSILEETTLGELFRVLTSIQSRVGVSEQSPFPKRKMGTASLTPPEVPSLLSLFTPPNPTAQQAPSGNRRFSLKPVPGSNLPPLNPTTARRFSLRRSSLTPSVTFSAARRSSLKPSPSPLVTTTSSNNRRASLFPAPNPNLERGSARSRFSVRLVPNSSLNIPPPTSGMAPRPIQTPWMRLRSNARQTSDANAIPPRLRTNSVMLDSIQIDK